jgi:hypothetical protein
MGGVGVEMCPGAALSVAHGLRLVVGREHVLVVLAPEHLRLLRRRPVEQAGALADRLGGGVRHERQLAAGTGALNNRTGGTAEQYKAEKVASGDGAHPAADGYEVLSKLVIAADWTDWLRGT